MKIIIDNDPLLSVKIDKKKFEQEMKKELELKESLFESIEIVKNDTGEEDLDEVKEIVYVGFDWYDLLMNFKYYKDQVEGNHFFIDMYKIKICNFTEYLPDFISNEHKKRKSYVLNYKVKKTDLNNYLFMLRDTNNLKDSLNKNVERMLCTNLIDYSNKEWKQEWHMN